MLKLVLALLFTFGWGTIPPQPRPFKDGGWVVIGANGRLAPRHRSVVSSRICSNRAWLPHVSAAACTQRPMPASPESAEPKTYRRSALFEEDSSCCGGA